MFFMSGTAKHVTNTTVATLVHTLPDESTIYLNAGAEIRYSTRKYKDSRDLELTGEAFFDVKKGAPFSVSTVHGAVTVLGTSFNVNATALHTEVAVRSGLVKVESNTGEGFLLDAGKAIQLSNLHVLELDVIANSVGMWAGLPYEFEDVPVRIVFERLSADTGFEIQFDKQLPLLFTGKFEQDEKIEHLMAIVCMPLGLEYHIDIEKKLITILNP